jgi:hypothetical protein
VAGCLSPYVRVAGRMEHGGRRGMRSFLSSRRAAPSSQRPGTYTTYIHMDMDGVIYFSPNSNSPQPTAQSRVQRPAASQQPAASGNKFSKWQWQPAVPAASAAAAAGRLRLRLRCGCGGCCCYYCHVVVCGVLMPIATSHFEVQRDNDAGRRGPGCGCALPLPLPLPRRCCKIHKKK